MGPKRRHKSFNLRQAQDRLLKQALTKLPELESVEPLLQAVAQAASAERRRSSAHLEESWATPEEPLVLPSLAQERGSLKNADAALYRAHRGPPRANSMLDSNGFRACLQLPQLSQEPQADAHWGERTRHAREWHVVLLPECIEGEGNPLKLAATARSLATELRMEQAKGDALVETAHAGTPALAATCPAQSEALRLATALRDRGLAVRVTSRPFADPSTGSFTSRVQEMAKLCGGTLRGDLFRLASRVQRGRAVGVSRCTDWRRTTDMQERILPEDPAEAFLREQRLARLQARVAPARKRFSRLVMACSSIASAAPADEQPSVSRASSYRTVFAGGDGGARTPRTTTGPVSPSPDDWGAASGKSQPQKVEISPMWREACRQMRIFVFGRVALEADDEEESLQEALASRESLAIFRTVWIRLDADSSGRVSIEEFNAFTAQHMKNALELSGSAGLGGMENPEAFAQQLADRVEKLLLNRKSSFSMEDMMRFLWPAASRSQIRQMKMWLRELANLEQRIKIKPPPVLPREELEGLRSLFRQFDKHREGSLRIADLVDNGVILEAQAERYQQEWDRSGTGRVDLLDFFEIMCPTGYRAHAYSTSGSLPDGRPVLYDHVLQIWRAEDSADELDWGSS